MRPALILQYGPTGPPGLLGEWAESRDVPLQVHHTYLDKKPLPEIDDRAFVRILGSKHSPLDHDYPEVFATLDLAHRAVEDGIPVLGLCFGGEVLADVLGAMIEPAPEPEIGWYTIDSDDTEMIAPGPWLEWHYERFTLPPGATQLASSPAGVQAFVSGPHLAVQFHPESTIEIAADWARSDRQKLEQLGLGDGEDRLEAGRGDAPAAKSNAFRLFDGFWKRVREERKDPWTWTR